MKERNLRYMLKNREKLFQMVDTVKKKKKKFQNEIEQGVEVRNKKQ